MNDLLRRMASLGLTKTTASRRGCLAASMNSPLTCLPFANVGGVRAACNYQSAHIPFSSSMVSSKFSTLAVFSSSPSRLHRHNDDAIQCLGPATNKFSTQAEAQPSPSAATPTIVTDDFGQQYGMLLDTRKLPKLKPSIVKRRLSKLHSYVGQEKDIRHSPWKLNLVCQLAAGLPLEDALTQLEFCDKKNAELVARVLKRTSNLADIRHGIQISQLEVVECFTTPAMRLKRIKFMGRGRYVEPNFA